MKLPKRTNTKQLSKDFFVITCQEDLYRTHHVDWYSETTGDHSDMLVYICCIHHNLAQSTLRNNVKLGWRISRRKTQLLFHCFLSFRWKNELLLKYVSHENLTSFIKEQYELAKTLKSGYAVGLIFCFYLVQLQYVLIFFLNLFELCNTRRSVVKFPFSRAQTKIIEIHFSRY